MSAINFITSETCIIDQTIQLSKLFLWYKADFIHDKSTEASTNTDDNLLLK